MDAALVEPKRALHGAVPLVGALLIALTSFVGTARALQLPRNGALPFAQPRMGLADTGETLVAYRNYIGGGHWDVRATLGTPGGSFSSPQVLTGQEVVFRGVAMDAAGNAAVVWDKAIPPTSCQDKFGCDPSDVQLFVAVRRAGEAFGQAQLIGHETPHSTPAPMLAASRHGGYAVVYSCQFQVWCVVAGAAGEYPRAPQRLSAAQFAAESAGVDDAGNVTVGGYWGGSASVVVWHPDGTTGPIQALDSIQDPSSSTVRQLDVGGAGQAIAGWGHGGQFAQSPGTYVSVRPAGGTFGAPVLLRASVGAPLVGIDGQGRGLAVWGAGAAAGGDVFLTSSQEATGDPFGEPARISLAGRTLEGGSALSVSHDGDAGLVWLDAPGRQNQPQHAHAAFRRGTGPFGPVIGLSDGDEEAPDLPGVAFDANGHAVVMWSSVADGEERILVQGFGAAGVTPPTTVVRAPAPRVRPPLVIGPVTDVGVGQLVHMRRNGRVYPMLHCDSDSGVVCRGTVRIRTLHIRGRQRRYTVAQGSFRLGHGQSRRVSLRVFRTARRALRKRMLDCDIASRTRNPRGHARTDSEELFIARTRRR